MDWASNPPTEDIHETPDQCFFCGEYYTPQDKGKVITVDTDPGDPEVGPQPCIETAWICTKCATSKEHAHGQE